QVTLGCNKFCEACSKYFDCASPQKYKMYDSPALRVIEQRMKGVKHKIAVMSGKGGVGKSTVTANLGMAFHLMGATVGLLDSDFYGPSIPTIMGVRAERLLSGDDGIVPVNTSHGIKVASVGSTLGDTDSVTWLGDQMRWGLYQFLGGTYWGELDVLLIDLPPGTGEETLNVMKTIRGLAGAVVVTIPSEVSQIVVGRGIALCQKANTKILGVIENMGSMACPSCNAQIDVFMAGGGRLVAEKMGVPFLGTIPLDKRVSEASDTGEPFVFRYPDSPASKVFMEMTANIAREISLQVQKREEP
ncbi:MAG: Mrp/NBP35 family ATP-binding protein, partial [Dehalococcoidia bacterium]|nr:Mrp/NBP35 family ATP-binding protein [Dehalococcoidia bacterium]